VPKRPCEAGDLLDGQVALSVFDPAQRGLADVQPIGDQRLRKRLAVEGVKPVRADHAPDVTAVQSRGHRPGAPELGRHVGCAVAPALHLTGAAQAAGVVTGEQGSATAIAADVTHGAGRSYGRARALASDSHADPA
jgi:hypothetical protein